MWDLSGDLVTRLAGGSGGEAQEVSIEILYLYLTSFHTKLRIFIANLKQAFFAPSIQHTATFIEDLSQMKILYCFLILIFTVFLF